ncbi:MAG TPA: alpha/beta hydrolase [Candidatus Dormibacteraeota bacterium]|nr:alpha/beta hydrolase [Candidatus Dormibacteraeota bacterium]
MRSLHLTANRLTHHLLEWGSGARVVLLLHGFLEHAHVWELVAPRLAEAGLHVYALDWRGHGDSQWVGAGGYYHFADYVADLDGIVRGLGGRAALVAHSMGGNAAVLYAGTMPERATALVSIEGLGPPGSDPADAPERYAQWLLDIERAAARPRPAFTAAAGLERLRERYPRMSEAALALLAEHGTRVEGDARVWKFDPLHQTRSPQPYYAAQGRAFWQRVACPVLYVEGDESFLRLPDGDLAERLAALRAERAMIHGSAHHPHLEQPEALAKVLVEFLTVRSAE